MELEPGVHARAPITRGAATIYNGKLFRVTIDNHLLALDMKTGKQVWNQKFADCEGGLLRHQRADRRQRRADLRHGRRRVHDARVPRRLGSRHRQEAVAPLHHPGARRARLRDVAEGQRRLEVRRRADVALGLLRSRSSIWSTGAPATPSRTIRGRARRWTACITSSVLAIRPKTGEIVCYFQYTPNDVYDVDGTDEHVLADIQVGGQPRKVMIQANKNGFLYVLDRTNCKLIAAHPLRQGQLGLAHRSRHRPAGADRRLQALPRRRGGRDLAVARHQRGADRLQSEHRARLREHLEPAAHPEARAAEAAGARRATPPASTARLPEVKPGDVLGHFVAINPLTGEKKWEVPLTDLPSSAGMLATGGGLVFTGKLTGEFVALDEDTGKTLWQFKTGSSINSTAITYTHKGRQYVTIASGLGGGLANRYAADKVPTGGSIWTFALMP